MREPIEDLENMIVEEAVNNDTNLSANEAQAIQDATKILFEPIDEKEIEDLESKNKSLIELLTQPTPSYNDLEKCMRLMSYGIVGTKYNYKNNKYRKVVLQISSDRKKILYQDVKEQSNFALFNGSTSLKVSKFNDVTYGGRTENFKKHRRILRRQFQLNLKYNNPNDAESSATSMRSMSIQPYSKEDCWYAWKCVSLIRADGKTLDISIADDKSLICFLHAVYHLICKPPAKSKFLRDFKMQKIKMKLNFEARQTHLHLSHMI